MSFSFRADQAVAVALARAFLSGTWEHAELVRRARETLRHRAGWFDPLVEEVLVLFPEAPSSSFQALVDVVSHSETFVAAAAAARTAGRPLRAIRAAPPPLEPSLSRWPVPALHDLTDLAAWLELSPGQLLWAADPDGRQQRERPGPRHLYTYAWTPRVAGAPRLLEAPTPILKRVQRELLHRLLAHVPVHPAAHGFVPGRSALTHARGHLGAQVVITIDLADFFAGITRGRVSGVVRSAGYGEDVGRALTGLCTTGTPGWVTRRMPAGGSRDGRYFLAARLKAPHLPQGAPTSPVLANLICHGLDSRLSGYAASLGGVYSRYADDLTFSGGAQLRLNAPAFVSGVTRIVREVGFVVNPAKTRVQPSSQRQLVTGVVVNERPNATRQQYDRLRAVLHEALTRGPEVANRAGHPDFRGHLRGRVEWVESLNHGRGARLRAEFEAITWPES